MKDAKSSLELDDYQPRGDEPLVRLTWNRAFPDGNVSPTMYAMHPRSLRENEPPMRDAVADLLTFLGDVQADLESRELHPVEAVVWHTDSRVQAEGQGAGWFYTMNVLAVPVGVIEDQAERFRKWQAEQVAPAR